MKPTISKSDDYKTSSSFDENKKVVSSCLEIVSKKCFISSMTEGLERKTLKTLQQLNTFKGYNQIFLYEGFQLSSNGYNSSLLLLSVNSIIEKVSNRNQIKRKQVTEWEFFGLVNLTKDYGSVYIRPETIADKITELIFPVEIDFSDNPEFSKKYYVLASNEEHLRKQVSQKFLDCIQQFDDLEIEIHGSTLMARTRKPVSISTGSSISSFLLKVNDGKN